MLALYKFMGLQEKRAFLCYLLATWREAQLRLDQFAFVLPIGK